jgi:hypothetical protein
MTRWSSSRLKTSEIAFRVCVARCYRAPRCVRASLAQNPTRHPGCILASCSVVQYGHEDDIDGPLFRAATSLQHNSKASQPRRAMDPDAINWVVRKHAGTIGLARGYSAHSMRATFITTALENGRRACAALSIPIPNQADLPISYNIAPLTCFWGKIPRGFLFMPPVPGEHLTWLAPSVERKELQVPEKHLSVSSRSRV